MKARIKALLKSSPLLYEFYYYIGSFILKFIGCFIPMNESIVLFVSYGGQKFDDSPRVIYEKMLESNLDEKFKLFWAFQNPELYPNIENKVRIDSLAYYLLALRAGYWITNSSASRGLNFKKKKTKNILFQHGMVGIKKIGKDIASTKGTYNPHPTDNFDLIFIEGKNETEILARAWEVDPSHFKCTGLPRNDDLVRVEDKEIRIIKEKLNIPNNKKVILYAPTFREQSRGSKRENALPIPFTFEKWERELGDEYVLLITAHYEVAKLLDELPKNEFVINAFKYPVINDLLKVADILISDYSSVFFDFSILEKPMLCYAYDYEEYRENRGLYVDLNTLFSHGVIKDENTLIEIILNMDYENECNYTKHEIKEKYIATYGNAAQRAIDIIWEIRDNVDFTD